MLSVVTYEDMFMNFTQQFLQSFEEIANNDFQNATYFDFEIAGRDHKKRINLMIRMATPEDIDEIIFTYKDIYENTYPYKEMEDREEIRKMLASPNVEWFIFETVNHEVVGCFTFMLDFIKRLGNIRGFVVKRKFIGKVDIMKMAIGTIITMYKKYNDRIFRWYGECRTAHSKSQFFCSALGFKPVGFYPCKDIFYNKVESDLLIVSYDERALTTMRSKKIPCILSEALNGYLYSDKRYNLGSCQIRDSEKVNLHLNFGKIQELQNSLVSSVSIDRFGYETINFSIPNSDSFFEFLYTPTVQNFEKTHYEVENLEELYVFVQKFLEFGLKYKIRYCEAFISAYEPSHQKIFMEFGLNPCGYVPSWKYNQRTGTFDDCVLFGWYDGEINNLRLLDEGKALLDILGLQYSIEPRKVQERKKTAPFLIGLKEKWNPMNHTKILKSSLMVGLVVYMSLLFGSLGVASTTGYSLITHTISELAVCSQNPFPFLFDLSCISGGISSGLFYYLMSSRLNNHEKCGNFLKYSTVPGMIGSIGIFFVGVFSLERSNGFLHGLFSVIAFAGFIISINVFSLRIYRLTGWISKLFLVNGLIPIISLILYFVLLSPLSEWIMLLSIIFSLIPLISWTIFK